MRRNFGNLLCVTFVLALFSSVLASAQTYTVTDLGPISTQLGINNAHQVVGSDNLSHGFIWQNGTITDINAQLSGPYTTSIQAMGINSSGQVALTAWNTATSKNNALRWNSRDGTFIVLGDPNITAYANAINDAGQVTGYDASFGDGYSITAFRWDPNQGLVHLINPYGTGNSVARGINTAGNVVGDGEFSSCCGYPHAFLWNGTIHNIEPYSGQSSSTYDINDAGQIVGNYGTNVGPEAFIRSPNGLITPLGFSWASAINNLNQVVGSKYNGQYLPTKAYLWQNGVATDLNTIRPNSFPPWLWEATDINDSGEIVCRGGVSGDSQTHGFLLRPTPIQQLTGRVVFEDQTTAVTGAEVVIRGNVDLATAPVQTDGTYAFRPDQTPSFNLLGYTVYARYRIPAEFTYPRPGSLYQEYAIEPYLLQRGRNLQVSLDGTLSQSHFDFTFPWPVLMLHGLLSDPTGDAGPPQLEYFQNYLTRPASGRIVRRGFITFVPNLGDQEATGYWRRTIEEYHWSLRNKAGRIFSLFPPTTKFNLVGYSQGGLVAREVVDDVLHGRAAAPHIGKVIQIATPNNGTCVANDNLASRPYIADLQVDPNGRIPGSIYDFNYGNSSLFIRPHNYLGSRQGMPGSQIPFYVMAGDRFTYFDPSLFVFNNTCLLNSTNAPMGSDGAVPVDSVLSLSTLGYNFDSTNHWQIFHANHLSILNSREAMALLYRWLLEGSPLQQ